MERVIALISNKKKVLLFYFILSIHFFFFEFECGIERRRKNATELEHCFPHGLNLVRFLFLDSHERVPCCSACTFFVHLIFRFHFNLLCLVCCCRCICFIPPSSSSFSFFLQFVCRLATMSASALVHRSHEMRVYCVAIFIATNRLLRYLMWPNACHIRISPISLFALTGLLVSQFSIALRTMHICMNGLSHTSTTTTHHTDPIY